jgi:ABC-type Fe2+-enterobactin transport system substrate-binding protein
VFTLVILTGAALAISWPAVSGATAPNNRAPNFCGGRLEIDITR